MTRYEQLERLKIEADRWIAAVQGDQSAETVAAASKGIRELMDKAILTYEPGPDIETLRWRAMAPPPKEKLGV